MQKRYRVRDEMGEIVIEANAADEALVKIRSDEDLDWEDGQGTVWRDYYVVEVPEGVEADDESLDDDEKEHTVAFDPPEPRCDDGTRDHDWQSPFEILGGLEENPGVHMNGGGVIITEVCMKCGCTRTTDTWAQRSGTGEQGLTSVRYVEGEYADAVEDLRDDA